jgi:hypothetical protein
MSDTTTVIPLTRRLLAIQEEIGTVAKNGRNDFQNYDYATEADFVRALRPLLNKHGVIVVPEGAVTNISPAGKDGKSTLTTIMMKYKLINADDVEDFIYATVPGQGMDNGDKGVYKAITGAKKYFIANTFMVPTGDDPEVGREDEKPAGRKLKTVSNGEPMEDF